MSVPVQRDVSRVERWLAAIGGIALGLCGCADGFAVAGRHLGFTVLGAIEVFQSGLVIALTCAFLIASVSRSHASVDLLMGRVAQGTRARLEVIGNWALALTFGLIAAGSGWIAIDHWGTSEITELLAIPVLPLRILWALGCVVAAAFYAAIASRGGRA